MMSDTIQGDSPDAINDLVEQYQARRIDRRSFMQRASAVGLSAATISALIGVTAAAQGDEEAGVTASNPGAASLFAQLSDDLANAVERAGAATVTVFGRRRLPASGIVWDIDGHIVTANHVVERDDDLSIGLPDGREVAATLIGRDSGSDLAVLRVQADDLTAAVRSSAPVRVGHLVLAVGRPGNSGAMASFGAVSVVGGAWRTSLGGTVDGFVRADVAMLPGFSGGPLVNAAGDIVGLNSSTLGRGGGLTVPNTAIDLVVEALVAHGKVRRGFLGIAAQTARITPVLQSTLNLTQERGLLLVGLEPDGPAEREGLFLGDVIVAIDQQPVAEVEDLQDRLAGDKVGQTVAVTVIRGGQLQDVPVVVGERP